MHRVKSYWYRWRPGQEASLASPCSNVRSFGSKCTALKYCSLLLALLGPRSHSASGASCPLPPVVMPLITVRSDAPQKTMVLSSNQRHEGIFGFGGTHFQFVLNFALLWWKRIGKLCRAMILLKQRTQKYQEVFPEFFKILPESPPPPACLWRYCLWILRAQPACFHFRWTQCRNFF